jgi:hypothetical protein
MKELTQDEIQLLLNCIDARLFNIEKENPFPPENPYEMELVREYLKLKDLQNKMGG